MTPCPKCGATERDGRNRCRACRAKSARDRTAALAPEKRAKRAAKKKAWRATSPERDRVSTRKRRYGIDGATVEALVENQGNLCAVCRARKPACVDHCHRTGRIRGMLCMACNAGLGLLRDDAALLRAAAAYLSRT